VGVISSIHIGVLGETDNFFNYQALLAKYREKGMSCCGFLWALMLAISVLRVFDMIQRDTDRCVSNISIFGEIFGGTYPHKHVARVEVCVCGGV
jgi:hypothetical protein